MLHKKWFAIALSASMLNSAFFIPTYFSWLVFFFLTPIFWCVLHDCKLSFKEGFVWGLLFNIINVYAFIIVLLHHAQGWFRVVTAVLLVIYLSAYSGLWFFAAHFFSRYNKLISWLVTSWFYFIGVYYFAFWVFGQQEGCTFGFPVLPLAEQPSWLYFLPVLKHQGLLLLIIGCSMLCVISLRNSKMLLGVVICLTPFMYGWFVCSPGEKPLFFYQFAYVQPPKNNMSHPLDAGQEIAYAIQKAHDKNQDATIFLMPESSYKFPLNKHPEIVQLWTDFALPEGGSLLVGSQRKKGGCLFNSLFHIKERRIMNYYDKSHCMFLTERRNILWDNGLYFTNLFLMNKNGFTQSTKWRGALEIARGLSLLPYICSDFFFSTQAYLQNQSIPLIVVVNDDWFSSTPYLPHCMWLFARFKALEWQRDILYVSYTNTGWISKQGDFWLIS